MSAENPAGTPPAAPPPSAETVRKAAPPKRPAATAAPRSGPGSPAARAAATRMAKRAAAHATPAATRSSAPSAPAATPKRGFFRRVADDLNAEWGFRTATVAALLLVSLAFVGCAGPAELTTARIRLPLGTNAVVIDQPKDVTIGRLEFSQPDGGRVVLVDYASAANAGAIAAWRAQSDAMAGTLRDSVGLLRQAGDLFLRAQSGGLVGLPAGTPAAPVVATNPLPALVPLMLAATNAGPAAAVSAPAVAGTSSNAPATPKL